MKNLFYNMKTLKRPSIMPHLKNRVKNFIEEFIFTSLCALSTIRIVKRTIINDYSCNYENPKIVGTANTSFISGAVESTPKKTYYFGEEYFSFKDRRIYTVVSYNRVEHFEYFRIVNPAIRIDDRWFTCDTNDFAHFKFMVNTPCKPSLDIVDSLNENSTAVYELNLSKITELNLIRRREFFEMSFEDDQMFYSMVVHEFEKALNELNFLDMIKKV